MDHFATHQIRGAPFAFVPPREPDRGSLMQTRDVSALRNASAQSQVLRRLGRANGPTP